MNITGKIESKFKELYNTMPVMFRAPGRINLIGEHTDYNEGFVLPAAIDKAIYFALAPNTTGKMRFYSYDFDEYYETEIENPRNSGFSWTKYVSGVIELMRKDGKKISGLDCVFGGDLPVGAGISSSAALECGLGIGINKIFHLGYNKMELAKLCQQAEHEYAGVKCGIMDQFAVLHGKHRHAIKLDTRTLQFEYIPLANRNYKFILVDTGIKHSLAASEYNKRRKECETGVKILQQYDPAISSLRDVSLDFLQQHKAAMDDIIYDRCSYVVEENMRVEKSCAALKEGDYAAFGKQMYLSHLGLKEKYMVSCDELDMLVDIAKNSGVVAGARMMGGGFGGCTINLIEKKHIATFTRAIIQNYKTPQGTPPLIIEVSVEEGANILNG